MRPFFKVYLSSLKCLILVENTKPGDSDHYKAGASVFARLYAVTLMSLQQSGPVNPKIWRFTFDDEGRWLWKRLYGVIRLAA
jgi:hypothetical protein